jgi:biopolymer transport protein ExbD
MRRFSQRNPLVTLSDINITPLLDLAFVLLIIFVIISPSITSSQEHGMELKLPKGGRPDRQLDPKDIHSVEVNPSGVYMLDRRALPIDQIEKELIKLSRTNPNLIVMLRADENSFLKYASAVMNICQNNGIAMNLRTEPKP